MKKVLIVIVFFVVLFLSSFYGGNELVKSSTTYDMDEISKINVNLDKADVNIITTDIDKIQVETSSNAHTTEDETYFSYVEDETLYIENYVTNENFLLNPKTKINIYIPNEANIEQIDVDLMQGSVALSGVALQVANIQGEDVSISVADSDIDILNIATLFGNVVVKNTNASEVNVNCTKAKVQIDHLVSNVLTINSNKKVNVEYINSVVNLFSTSGENINISMTLYDIYDYKITSNIPFENSAFVNTDDYYTYDSQQEEGVNEFFFVNTKIQEISFSTK